MKKIFLSFVAATVAASCSVENIVTDTPEMITYEPQNILTTSASIGGMTLSEGGKPVTEYGIVYALHESPTTADSKIAVGERIGDFYINVEDFEPATTYYYRSYGINEIGTGYGETFNFTTQEEAPCQPVQDNFIDTGLYTMTVNDVDKRLDNWDGNVRFETTSNNINTRIELRFNEIDRRLPLTGTYTIGYSFESQEALSQGKVLVSLHGYLGWEWAGAIGVPGSEIYVENNDGVITFIFCDLVLSNDYTLNGKFTYTE